MPRADAPCRDGVSLDDCRARARARHLAGEYDGDTLACYLAAWRLGGKPADLLAYLSFRRDLGYPLNGKDVAAVRAALSERGWRCGPREWLGALNFLAEVEALPDFDRLPGPVRLLLRAGLYSSPPLASWVGMVRGGGGGNGFRAALARIDTEQATWRKAFRASLLASRGSLCVVGNSAELVGGEKGAWIDGHACVIRFNQFASSSSRPEDVGRRTDVWVRAPGFSPQGLSFSGAWVVASGPDLRYRLTNWRGLGGLPRRGIPVLTVPLPLWRDQVGRLHAPPTAGLLMLAWLRDMLGGLRGVSFAGFSLRDAGQYHHALPEQTAGQRHRWKAERAIVAGWIATDETREGANPPGALDIPTRGKDDRPVSGDPPHGEG
jgi:hypothetical protein